jgi:hypothetical protein
VGRTSVRAFPKKNSYRGTYCLALRVWPLKIKIGWIQFLLGYAGFFESLPKRKSKFSAF